MKQVTLLFYKTLLLMVCLSYCNAINAYDFEVDGLCYNKLSSNQVEITYRVLYDGGYSGNLVIPEKVKYGGIVYNVVAIGNLAFYNCKKLTGTLTIPNSITSIGYNAFTNCEGFVGSLVIPNSVVSIGGQAFLGCKGLNGSLTLPNSISSIEKSTFSGCSGLTGSLIIPSKVKSIGRMAFSDCSGFTGSLIIPSSVTTIDEWAFYGCGFTGSLTIPNSVTSIGPCAFYQCKGFTGSLTIPNSVTTINEFTFDGCSGLTGSLIIPNSIKSIGKCAFQNCSGLTGSLIIPNSVISIGDDAFNDCSSLTGQLSIPSSVTSIGNNPFRGCYNLTAIVVDGKNTVYDSRNNSNAIIKSSTNELITGCKSTIIPNSITSIASRSFYRQWYLNTITIPSSVTSIGKLAFYGCNKLDLVKSYVENPFIIDNDIFEKISSSAKLEVPKGTKSKYQVLSGWTSHFKEIVEFGDASTFTLSITAAGNGSALYNSTTIRGKTSSFTVNEGSSAKISFTPDNGYRIKSVKVNNTTVSVSNNQYTISNINANTTVSVEFEAIPVTTYTLSITATGNGSALYGSTTIRSMTNSFTVNAGISAMIIFYPDDGYRIKSVKVNGSSVTVTNNQYTISNISKNTTVEVEFEAIPVTTYTLSITASGNGSASYSGTTVRGKTSSFTMNAGTSAKITFSPDNGYRIKSVKVNGSTVTVSNNQYTISNIKANTTVSVEFEAITYTLSITASGSGSASYGSTTIRSKTSTFTVNAGSSATITFTPDNDYRIKSVKVNNSTVSVSNNQYTISSINANTTVSVEFEAIPITTYTLSITASGNGSVTYNGTTIRGKTNTFTVNEGLSATITFSPENGHRIKSVIVNNLDVTANISFDSNTISYTISSINNDTSVEVEFELFPALIEIEELIKQMIEKCDSAEKILVEYKVAVDNSPLVLDYSDLDKFSGEYASYSGDISSHRAMIDALKIQYKAAHAQMTYQDESQLDPILSTAKDVNSQIDQLIASITKDYEQFISIQNNAKTITIKAIGNGYAYCNSKGVRNNTITYTVKEGSSVTFVPDNGYQIKHVLVNNVTVSLTNNQYIISSINENTTIEVEFEAIPPTTYTLSITASGNGSASYDGVVVRDKTSSFTVNEGTSATISFTPDNGYRIKSVKVNNTTVSVSNNQYTISNINANTTVSVEFEAIPVTTYTLSITASGSGSASYGGSTIRSKTSSFTVNAGTSATITFTPDNGYRIKSVKVNNSTVSVSNNQYTISSINANTSVSVEFEAIPVTTYTLSITASGNGSASYDGTIIRSKTSSFTVNEGASATITFTPDEGYQIKDVKVNNSSMSFNDNEYTISRINDDTIVEVEFEKSPTSYEGIEINGIYYNLIGKARIAEVTKNPNNYTGDIIIPSTVEYKGITYDVASIGNYAFKACKSLSSINISDGITSIGEEAFYDCQKLVSVTIPGTVEKVGNYAFWNCQGLTSVHIKDLAAWCNIVFSYNSSNPLDNAHHLFLNGYEIRELEIPNTVTSISNYAFSGCTGLTSVNIPSSVTKIGSSVFSLCTGLTSVTIPNSVTSIGGGAFYGCSGLTSVTIPNTITSISNYAFSGCTGLTSVTIPNNVISIESSAFSMCKSLTSVTISNSVTTIGSEVFKDCISLTSVKIPSSVTKIGSSAFRNCSCLSTITIGSGIKTIESEAFASCSGLIDVYCHADIVPSTQDDAFKDSYIEYTTLHVPALAINSYKAAVPWNGFKEILSNETINTYKLIIKSAGCGDALYNGTVIRNNTTTFVANEGESVTISFSPDDGYRIKSVKVNNTAVSVSDNQYTISNISANTTVEVEFEAIPLTNYSLSIKSIGNGFAWYDETTIRNTTSSFTVTEGTNAMITFYPDDGYQIKTVKLNNLDITYYISNNRYTISNIKSDNTIEVEFEAIPTITYTLSITASGNGSASFNGSTIRNMTSSFTVNEGSSATITFTPDNGYRIKSVKVNGSTVSVTNNQYAVSNISSDMIIEVEFEAVPEEYSEKDFSSSGNGTETAPYVIDTDKQWIIFAKVVNSGNRFENACFVLGNDIDLSGQEYLPVGNPDNPFSGIIDCKNKTISNIKLEGDYTGLFGYIRNAKIANLVINGIAQDENGGAYMGGLVGYAESSYINNVIVEGRFTCKNNSYVGGLVGYAVGKTELLNCKSSIRVMGDSYAGGIVGYLSNGCSITNSMNRSAMYNYGLAGGVAGYNNGKIKNCYSASSMNGTQTQVGGVVGANDNEGIIDCGYYMKQAPVNSAINYYGTYDKGTASNCSSFDSSGNISGNAYNGQTKLSSALRLWVTHHQTSDKLYRQFQSNQSWPEFEDGYYYPLLSAKYNLIVKATGYGSASYNGTTIRNNANSFVVNDGSSATITFSPDNGYRIKSVKVNNTTVPVSNNQYTINSISSDTTIEVEFEAIPITTYMLSITVSGNGSASYNGTTVRSSASANFTVNEGTSATITFSPDNGNIVKSVKINGLIVSISNNRYTINSISKNTTVEVEFEKELNGFSVDNINYSVMSVSERTIHLAKGNYGMVLEVPAKVSYQNTEWTVTGVENGALASNSDLAAVVWNPDAAFTEQVSNPNFLLYVIQSQYAPSSIKNVVVNGTANSITLMDAASGNNFHCPQAFTAQKISYTHNYSMVTGIGKAQGWETIALPFDVQKVTHESKGEIVSFANWRSGDAKKPFWLMQLTGSGWTMAESIKANTPYIISMPNNPEYKAGFLLNGKVTFSAENVSVAKTENLAMANYSNRTFVPTFSGMEKSNDVLALNVVNDFERVTGGSTEGSTFVRNLRPVHPFEAYMTSTSSTRSIGIDEGMATGIIELISALSDEGDIRIYNLNGQLIKIEEGRSLDEVMRELHAGVYIVNGKKMIIR